MSFCSFGFLGCRVCDWLGFFILKGLVIGVFGLWDVGFLGVAFFGIGFLGCWVFCLLDFGVFRGVCLLHFLVLFWFATKDREKPKYVTCVERIEKFVFSENVGP